MRGCVGKERVICVVLGHRSPGSQNPSLKGVCLENNGRTWCMLGFHVLRIAFG